MPIHYCTSPFPHTFDPFHSSSRGEYSSLNSKCPHALTRVGAAYMHILYSANESTNQIKSKIQSNQKSNQKKYPIFNIHMPLSASAICFVSLATRRLLNSTRLLSLCGMDFGCLKKVHDIIIHCAEQMVLMTNQNDIAIYCMTSHGTALSPSATSVPGLRYFVRFKRPECRLSVSVTHDRNAFQIQLDLLDYLAQCITRTLSTNSHRTKALSR